jgi:alpha-D-ribose 1-methylphosphonate 5-triphosphate diphosphatase PhnM
MKNRYQIINAYIVNEDEIFEGCVFIDNGLISHVQRVDFCETETLDDY